MLGERDHTVDASSIVSYRAPNVLGQADAISSLSNLAVYYLHAVTVSN